MAYVTLMLRCPSHLATSVMGPPGPTGRADTNACRKLCGVNAAGIPALAALDLNSCPVGATRGEPTTGPEQVPVRQALHHRPQASGHRHVAVFAGLAMLERHGLRPVAASASATPEAARPG
jgi:hypothetical protein